MKMSETSRHALEKQLEIMKDERKVAIDQAKAAEADHVGAVARVDEFNRAIAAVEEDLKADNARRAWDWIDSGIDIKAKPADAGAVEIDDGSDHEKDLADALACGVIFDDRDLRLRLREAAAHFLLTGEMPKGYSMTFTPGEE